jgi:hypothetical protein
MVMFLLWLLCFVGQAVHWYMKADAVKQASGAPLHDWMVRNQARIVARLFWVNLFFLGWCMKPDFVNEVARIVADHLTPGMTQSLLVKLGVPLNVLTAGAWGYMGDSLLDKARAKWLGGSGEFMPALNGFKESDAEPQAKAAAASENPNTQG